MLAAAEGVDVDHIMISATHNHEAPDTLGQWGQMVGKRGVDEAWLDDLKDQVVQSISEAIADLTPVTMATATADLSQSFLRRARGTSSTTRETHALSTRRRGGGSSGQG